MLSPDFKKHLEDRFDFCIKGQQALNGGDINDAYLLSSEDDQLVLKVNQVKNFPDLFQKEANGLHMLRSTETIDVPKVYGYGNFDNFTYLLIEYKKPGKVRPQFWEDFGQQLAALHQQTNATFGFSEDNYVGSLQQYNGSAEKASEFYIEQRLKPQFEIATKNGFTFENLESFYQKVEHLVPDEPPALIHGDLWSGNYVVNSEHQPCLIDPAVAYAPREMDLAMMKLFGGFDDKIFETYHEHFPLEKDWEQRLGLWQLYYILVHLNIFGGHYYSRAKELMSQYID